AQPDLPRRCAPAARRRVGVDAQAGAVVRRGAGAGVPAAGVDDPEHRAAGAVRVAAGDPADPRQHPVPGPVLAGLRPALPLPARPPRALAPGGRRRRAHRRPVRAGALGHRPVPGAGGAGQRLRLDGHPGPAAGVDVLRGGGVLRRRVDHRGDRRAGARGGDARRTCPGLTGRARPANAIMAAMARLSDAFIDDLLARTDIVEVIHARVPLKRQGKEYSARCPFHDERSPSFTVSPTKQFYHCFGCGAHGTAISFLMNYDRLEFLDAVDELARRAGIEVPRETRQRNENSDARELFGALEAAAQFFRRHLAGSDKARAYLDGRGVDEATRERFAIGYAPDGFSALRDALGTDARRMNLLERAGLFSKNDRGNVYDKFRDRVMFPIHDRRGRPIAFGGRVLDADASPKYLNSPETALFHKGRELYGLWQVRQANSKIERLVVVEGYMDVVALFEHGVPHAVATLGTATTPDHAELLFRNAPDVFFCFDGDRAGRGAAWKAVESVLPRMRDGRQAFFLFLPDGEDPDTIVRKEGAAGFDARLQQATPLSQFFFDTLSDGIALGTLDGKARLAERAKPLLAQIPDGAFGDLMRQRLTEL